MRIRWLLLFAFILLTLVAVQSLVVAAEAKSSAATSNKVISPQMTAVVESNGEVRFYSYPEAARVWQAGRQADMQAISMSSDDVVAVLDSLFEAAKKKVCGFKYRPESFSVSVAGFVSASWNTKDVCK
jgi:hypothetical protein